MTTPSSSSLSHALKPPTAVQKPPTELPRLQLAPPEHQKHLQTQAQARQQQENIQQTTSIVSAQRRPGEHATPQSSSREVSPAVEVEITHPTSGDKRKSSVSRAANPKKRRTDEVAEEAVRDSSQQYGLGTHYPFASYGYPGAPPPPPALPFNSPAPPNPPAEMSFNEFQWRLLNLCSEFYEAATELIRATPHLVLSQAFQLLNRGSGLDPITVLNDARRTCDMLLANPQALATAPPVPTALHFSVLTSLAHLNTRASMSVAPPAAIPPPSYPQQTHGTSAPSDKGSQQAKERDRQPATVQGTWKEHEVQRLKMLAEKYRIRDKAAVAQEEEEEEEEEEIEDGEGLTEGEGSTQPSKKSVDLGDIDWDKVVAEFGDERSRHQVLIKATYLGLKPSSTLPGKKPKKKKNPITTTELPPPTFSSASAKSIPARYPGSQLDATQSPTASSEGPTTSPTGAVDPLVTTAPHANSSSDSQGISAPPLPGPLPQHSQHNPAQTHAQYPQTGWYPHPQNPYYAYHQPLYYSTHPPSYGMQNFIPPQQGYYGQSFSLPGTEPHVQEKQAQVKGKRKEMRKSNGPASGSTASSTPIPPPSLPAKDSVDSSSVKPSTTVGGPLSTDTPGSEDSTPRITPAVQPGSTATSSSGVLRRGPNSALFTYTPLPHGGGTSTDQTK